MATRALIPAVIVVGLLVTQTAFAVTAPGRVAALTEIEIDEPVDGDVLCLGGNVVLGPSAVIRGHVVVVFGRIVAAPQAVVEGRTIAISSVDTLTVRPSTSTEGNLGIGLRLLTAGGWLLTTTLIAFLFPARVRFGVWLVPALGLKVMALGIMVYVTLLAALVAAFGLGPGLGVALAAAVGVAFIAIKAVGLTLIGATLGGIAVDRGIRRPLPLTCDVFLGVLALLMLRFVPLVGGALWTVASLAAVGAGVFTAAIAPTRTAARSVPSETRRN